MPRKATGATRPIPMQTALNQDEDEILAREVEAGLAPSKTEALRRAKFPSEGRTKARLLELREKQKHLPMEKFRRELKK